MGAFEPAMFVERATRLRMLSRPFTLSGWTYEVCLKCGKKFAYDRADIGCNVPQLKERESGPCRGVSDEDYASVSVLQR